MTTITDLLAKHCPCATENRILVEAVSVCPDCYAFYSTSAYRIPADRLETVLGRLEEVMREMGIEPEAPVAVTRPCKKAHASEEC